VLLIHWMYSQNSPALFNLRITTIFTCNLSVKKNLQICSTSGTSTIAIFYWKTIPWFLAIILGNRPKDELKFGDNSPLFVLQVSFFCLSRLSEFQTSPYQTFARTLSSSFQWWWRGNTPTNFGESFCNFYIHQLLKIHCVFENSSVTTRNKTGKQP